MCNGCTEGSPYEIWQILEQGALNALVVVLDQSDVEMIILALNAISHILDSGVDKNPIEGSDPINENYLVNEFEELGGIELVSKLQMHQNKDIYENSIKILENHYRIAEIINI